MNYSKLISLAIVTLSVATAYAHRADRATITWVVSDPSGQSIVGASMKITSDDTGVITDLKTNENRPAALHRPEGVIVSRQIHAACGQVSGAVRRAHGSIAKSPSEIFSRDAVDASP